MRQHQSRGLLADLDVLVVRLLREVEHVAREERLAVELEELLVRLEHPVEPAPEERQV